MINNKRENIIIKYKLIKYRKKKKILEYFKVQKVIKYKVKRQKIL